ncbi:nuclear transport factor 2 family protein [Solirubrobacter soli]|uniref:nuclear transport factor 2 family protein n=1 Tax=Solirubrobacter soli TaxID=363832 RepID=UPI00041219A4|nr:nuclear transport factor 2 family protein [Solirubrobacter soli]
MRRAFVLALVVLAGCGGTAGPTPQIRQAVGAYYDSILANDDAHTCGLFSAYARLHVVKERGVNCPQALGERLFAQGVPKLVRDRFVPRIVSVRVHGIYATVKVRPSPLLSFSGEVKLVREKGRWRIDSDEPRAKTSAVGDCVWGYSRLTLADPEWKPWSDRAKAEYTERFCREIVKRDLMKVDHGMRLARVEQAVVNSLYDDGLMTRN